ncbi:MAG TPA: SPFH domain-containing protein [Pirellulales bacterium]|nr:SPFH domain-containing protein [Pirellulales bacterium]
MLTGDLNLGHVEWIVQYRVKDPMEFLLKVGSTERIDLRSLPSGTISDVNAAVPDTISDVSESVMRKLVGDSSIDYVLTIGREQLANQAEELIQEEVCDEDKTYRRRARDPRNFRLRPVLERLHR